jgi:hypothetical protein
MKKRLLASIIGSVFAATLITGANAATTGGVTSNITSIQLWVGDVELLTHEAPGFFSNLAFGGTAQDLDDDGYIDSANLTFNGLVGFTINGLNIQLDFNLHNGGFVSGSGVTFQGGGIGVSIQTTSGWVPYGAIDASVDNLGFLANQPGHMAWDFPDQTTAGIVRDTLPGLWDGDADSASFNRAAGSLVLLGQSVGFFMEGSIMAPNLEGVSAMRFGPPEVPVPAGAWLFGTSLLGLAGARRLRNPPA